MYFFLCAEHFVIRLLICSSAIQEPARNPEHCSDHVKELVIRQTLVLRSMETKARNEAYTQFQQRSLSRVQEEHDLTHDSEHTDEPNPNTSAVQLTYFFCVCSKYKICPLNFLCLYICFSFKKARHRNLSFSLLFIFYFETVLCPEVPNHGISSV